MKINPWEIVGALAAGVAGYSWLVEPHWIELTEYRLNLEHWPHELNGFFILHLSDLHGRMEVFSLPRFKAWCKQADMIVVTGDLFSSIFPRIQLARALDQLTAPYGVYYISGNHDYRQETLWVDPWQPGSRLLDNKAVHIGPPTQGFWLAGLPDLVKGQPDMAQTLSQIHSDEPAILLSHRPDIALDPRARRFQLVLSGHTHGGQIAVPWYGALLRHTHLPGRYAAGLWRKAGYPLVLTSRGLGTSELPMRFASRPQVLGIRLYRSES
ncbi:MAG: metallophosphoesterase [Firmicutes bacterium]|nr:metallophosphoesterase [Bacillota bacterium]